MTQVPNDAGQPQPQPQPVPPPQYYPQQPPTHNIPYLTPNGKLTLGDSFKNNSKLFFAILIIVGYIGGSTVEEMVNDYLRPSLDKVYISGEKFAEELDQVKILIKENADARTSQQTLFTKLSEAVEKQGKDISNMQEKLNELTEAITSPTNNIRVR